MEFEEFIEKIKCEREEIAKEMCKLTGVIDYEKTLDSLNYLSLPLLLMFDEECVEYRKNQENQEDE